MEVLHTIGEVRAAVGHGERPLGLVPTMGFLHQGHMELVRRARAENSAVAVTIFVNPAQFGPGEDLAAYPRNMEGDLALLEGGGADLVFVPSPEEMYPPGFDTWVEVGNLARRLEGERRPGHFRGVSTVVLKLLNIVLADRAYFGQKDAQQLLVIRRLVRDLDVPTEVVAVPTVREPDGLAMSSRNSYLKPQERVAAAVLYRALTAARERHTAGERDAGVLRRAMADCLAAEPLADPDYVSVADLETLEELETVEGPALASLAVRMGRARLIDNVALP